MPEKSSRRWLSEDLAARIFVASLIIISFVNGSKEVVDHEICNLVAQSLTRGQVRAEVHSSKLLRVASSAAAEKLSKEGSTPGNLYTRQRECPKRRSEPA